MIYVAERSRVSSQHKLPTASEVASVSVIGLILVCGSDREITVQRALDELVESGELIQYGPYYSTEKKDVL